MRRKDRERDREFALKVIDESEYGVLCMNNGETPFSIPLSMVRDGNNLYFHGALKGTKAELLSGSKKVTAVFVSLVKVPDIYSREEIKEFIEKDQLMELTSKIFTTEFKSAIVYGTSHPVEDDEEKIKALKLICEKYTPDKMEYFSKALKKSLQVTSIYRIEIETVTGKEKKLVK